jgi:hypothetical protein
MSIYSVTNQTTGQVFSMVQSIGVGETLIADHQAAAIRSAGALVTVGGASRYGSWQPPRNPFRLAQGTNLVRFDVASGDQASTCLMTWSNTYI